MVHDHDWGLCEIQPPTLLQSFVVYSPAILEPDIHWGKTAHLAEDHLLTGLGSNGLGQELANFPRIEMINETPNTGLPEASQTRHEVEPFTDGGVWIIVDTLLGCSLSEHIGQEGGVSGFLVSHKFDERHVLGIETGLEELSFGEAGEAIVEEVQLNPFLKLMLAGLREGKAPGHRTWYKPNAIDS